MGRWIHLFIVMNHLAVKCYVSGAIQAVRNNPLRLSISLNDVTDVRLSLFTRVEIFSSSSVMCCVMLTSTEFKSLDGCSTCSGESLFSNSLTYPIRKIKYNQANNRQSTFLSPKLMFRQVELVLKFDCISFDFVIWGVRLSFHIF